MTDKSSISRLRKWIGRAIWNDEGYYRAPSNADAHQWHKKARQAERELAKTETLIDLLNLEDMEGDFNMCMDMQRKAHDGNRDDITRKFWLDKTRHKRSLIEAYESLMKESQ